ncbi:plasmid pRiA4b ORF-3 family protein [Rhodococcus sp. 3Y1]
MLWSVVAASPLGRSHGHHRAVLVTVSGQVSRPPLGSSYCPLTNVSTQIWRRILVASDLNLDDLHSVVQRAMGWSDRQSHAWSKSGSRFPGEVEEYVASGSNAEQRRAGRAAIVESAVRLDEVMVSPGDEISYRYGRFGNWRHTLTLESSEVLPEGFQVVCAAGRGACPPEECVGPDEYEQLLGVLASRSCAPMNGPSNGHKLISSRHDSRSLRSIIDCIVLDRTRSLRRTTLRSSSNAWDPRESRNCMRSSPEQALTISRQSGSWSTSRRANAFKRFWL